MSDVTVTETVNEVTVSHEAVAVTPVEQVTEVTVASGVTDHGALTGLADDDHTQYLLKAGGTMTGALVLDGDPAQALEAATKQYVDNNAGGASDVDDLTTDTGSAGEMVRVAAAGGLEYRSAAQVLSDIGAAAAADLADYLPLAGGTVTGNLNVIGAKILNQFAGTAGSIIMERTDGSALQLGLGITGVGGSGARFVFDKDGPFSIQGRERANVLDGSGSPDDAILLIDGATGDVSIQSNMLFVDVDAKNVGIGTTEPRARIHAVREGIVLDALANIARLEHRPAAGTPTTGFGAGLMFMLKSSTTTGRDAARIAAVWQTATDASRKADLVLSAFDTAEREFLRGRGNGSAAAIGFLGATPAVRQSHIADPSGGTTEDAEARAAINSILSVLETFGLVATS